MFIGKKRTYLVTQVLEQRKFKTKTKYVAIRWNPTNGYSFFKVMKQKKNLRVSRMHELKNEV